MHLRMYVRVFVCVCDLESKESKTHNFDGSLLQIKWYFIQLHRSTASVLLGFWCAVLCVAAIGLHEFAGGHASLQQRQTLTALFYIEIIIVFTC
jgi:hypothetical protein